MILFATYTNLPVAGAARIDAAAPACAAPAPAATPTPVPSVPDAAMPTGRGPILPMPLAPLLFVIGVAGLLARGGSRARHRS